MVILLEYSADINVKISADTPNVHIDTGTPRVQGWTLTFAYNMKYIVLDDNMPIYFG